MCVKYSELFVICETFGVSISSSLPLVWFVAVFVTAADATPRADDVAGDVTDDVVDEVFVVAPDDAIDDVAVDTDDVTDAAADDTIGFVTGTFADPAAGAEDVSKSVSSMDVLRSISLIKGGLFLLLANILPSRVQAWPTQSRSRTRLYSCRVSLVRSSAITILVPFSCLLFAMILALVFLDTRRTIMGRLPSGRYLPVRWATSTSQDWRG